MRAYKALGKSLVVSFNILILAGRGIQTKRYLMYKLEQ
jgi:hypothetical protein